VFVGGKKINIRLVRLEKCGCETLSRRSTILDIVFNRAVFAGVILLYILLIVANYVVSFIPTPWGMYLFVPVIIFSLISYLVDEAR